MNRDMRVSEFAMFVDDVPATAAFFRALLGEPAVEGRGIAIFQIGGVKLLIHERYEPRSPADVPCENHIAFAVPDLDAAVRELAAEGIAVERRPQTYEWGRSAYLRSPAGQLIELEQQAS